MSYILDALRQSERQRRRARPPDLHNGLRVPEAATTEPVVGRWRRPLALMLFILSALGTGYALGMLGRDWLQQDSVPPRLEGQVKGPASLPATSIIVAPEVQTVSSPSEPDRLKIRLDEPPAAPIRVEPQAHPEHRQLPQNPAPPAAEPWSTAAITTPDPEPERLPDPGVIDLRQLPSAIQSRLPPLSLSVHIYSTNAEHRMVKINEQMLREGQEVSPRLRLKSITPLGVILSFEGEEFHMRSIGG